MKKICFTTLVVMISGWSAIAQDWQQLDSLHREISQTTTDSIKASLCMDASKLLNRKAPDSALHYLHLADDIATKSLAVASSEDVQQRFGKLKGRALFGKAAIAHGKSQYAESEQLFQEVIAVQKQYGPPTELAYTYNFYSRIFERRGDHEQFIYWTREALKVQEQIGDSTGIAMSFIASGAYYERKAMLDSCLYFYEEALLLLRVTSTYESLTHGLYEYASVLGRMGKHERSMELLLEAIRLFEQEGDVLRIANGYLTLGLMCKKSGEIDKAEDYFLKAKVLNEELGNFEVAMSVANNMGQVYSVRNEHEKSLESYQKALKMAREKNAGPALIMIINNNVAIQYKKLGDIRLAIQYYEEAIREGRGVASPFYAASVFNNLARALLDDDQLAKAREAAKDAIELGLKVKQHEALMVSYSLLNDVYKKQGNYQAAHTYLEKSFHLQDSLSKADLENMIVEKETEFRVEQKEQQIATMEKEQQVQELTLANQQAEITQQRQYFLLALLFVLLLISVAGFLFNRFQLRQKNDKLLMSNRQLELEQEQEKTRQQLEMAQLRSDFFTNIAHEFRTPLTLILGPIQSLLTRVDPEQRKSVDRIQRNASRLLTLINETLDLARLDGGHLQLLPQQAVLGDFVEQVAHSFVPMAEVKQVQLEWTDESSRCLVDFDADKLQKVLYNLLGNAFANTLAGDRICLKVHAPEQETIALSVSDSGTGIEPEHVPHLFERFYQADPKAVKGTGVGLALSKELVELHGGSISVKSTYSKGSEFLVVLPLHQAETETVDAAVSRSPQTIALDAPAVSETHGARPTVLIIEDHAEVREYLEELMLDSYRVYTAPDGAVGIELAEEHSPDLIITDIMMPQKDGLELTSYLKQNLPTSHIPIILLTAKASAENKVEGLKTGADDYLTKPFDVAELMQRCANLIAQRAQLRQLFVKDHLVSLRKLTENKQDQSFLEKATQVIECHLDDPEFTVELFCRELAYNRSGVHLKLKALTGQNTTQFIRTTRLRKAADLILSTTDGMTEIAYTVGFKSRQTFNRAFKEHFQVTPTEYREKPELASVEE